ncbi:MAG: hypothetical protein EBZ36_13955, partial [Acidobacteria bacterium]|nr:hypothetical protein [Acidobacteriota bacterium]
CDIHVFDPSNTTKPIHDDTTRIHVHPWGFADRTQTLSSGVNNETLELKTIHDTKKELGHRRVDGLEAAGDYRARGGDDDVDAGDIGSGLPRSGLDGYHR